MNAQVAQELQRCFHEPPGRPWATLWASRQQLIAEINTEVLYQMSHHYAPEAARGVRWDDPALGIDWPSAPERVISERDAA